MRAFPFSKLLIFFFLIFSISSKFIQNSHAEWIPQRIKRNTLPIVYDERYLYRLLGLEKFHLFSNKPYNRIVEYLISKQVLSGGAWYSPLPLTRQEMLTVHSDEYFQGLERSPDDVFAQFEDFSFDHLPGDEVAQLQDVFLANRRTIAQRIVNAQLAGTQGTLRAAHLSLDHPEHWAINLSGGYHHAFAEKGSGFCLIADGPLAIIRILENFPNKRVLIVDLDAHHGDGNASFFAREARVRIFDIYNGDNFPLRRQRPPNPIAYGYSVHNGTGDQKYLSLLYQRLPEALEDFRPDVIFYNAGTDIFEKDPLGRLKITANGIVARDEFVFHSAKIRGIPIFMSLSGGYNPEVFDVIGRSIENIARVMKVD